MKHIRKDGRYPEKCQRFSIRKFNAGVASVAIVAFWMLGAATVSASEVSEVTTKDSIAAVESSDDTKASPDLSQMEPKAMEETEITPQILNQDEDVTSTENEVQENVELDRSELDNILLQIRSLDREQLTDLDVKQIDYYLSLSTAVSSQEEIDELSLMISSYINRLGTAIVSSDNNIKPRSATNKTKETVFVPADGVTITEVDGVETNSIPTDGFKTTKPQVYNMQTGQPNTNASTPTNVYHDPSRYTFAVIYTAHHGDHYNDYVGYEKSGQIWFGNEGTDYAGEYYYKAWRGQYTRVDQIAFSTDEDGSGRVYVTYYSGDGKVIKEDVFEKGLNREITYSYNGSAPYTFRYAEITALTDKANPTIAFDGPYPEGWFNELYTNYTRHNRWLTKNRYISYGYDVPVLVDKPTEYRDAETGQLLGTVIQTELSGYSFETSAPQTLKTSDGKTYTLVKERSENTSGKVTPMVNIHDGINIPRDAGYIVRHELIDEDGTIAWYILDENGNRTFLTETGEVATGTLALGEQITVNVNVPRQGETTFWINNPASNLGKTTYYYRAEVKTGSVQVRYITEDGKELEATSPVKTDEPVGTEYTTEQKVFDGYEFVKVDEKGATPTGEVEEGTKLVTYIYKPVAKTGSVQVRYITEDGKELEATSPVKTDEPVGTEYTTEQKVFDGYEFVKVDEKGATPTGEVEEGTKLVTYIYKPVAKTGSVQVRYITEDGKELEATSPVKTDEPVGTEYTTEQKVFDGYEFVKVDEKGAPAKGTVAEEDQVVTYIYKPVAKTGSVQVRYITEDGKELEATSPVKTDEPVGTEYTTEQKVFEGYEFVKVDEKGATPTGEVEEGTKLVTYIYKPVAKTGSVQVRYITEDGKELEATSPVKTDEPVGTEYTTEQKDFEGYEFVKVDEKGATPTGEVEEGTKLVTYIYKPVAKTGSVQVRYITEDGKELEATSPVKTDEPVGTEYTTEQKVFDGYEFVKVDEKGATPTGEVEEGTKLVTYIYKPVAKTGSVQVRYITEDGKELEATSPVKTDEPVGTEYTTEQKVFDGYEFVKVDEKGATPTGEVEEGTKLVTYIYKPVAKTGSVQVRYITEDGKELEATSPVKTDEPVGTEYTTEQKVFDGYEFVKVDEKGATPTGEVEEGTKLVTYIYKPVAKTGSVQVRYITEDGKELEATSPVKTDEPVGTEYTTEQKVFDGYEFVKVDEKGATPTGEVEEGTKLVTYIYKPVAKTGSVQVRYITEDGKELEATSPVKTDEPVGTEYTTEQKVFEGYEFVKVDEKGATPTGEVEEGTKLVTYIYKPVAKTGSVQVRYITEDGKELEATSPVKTDEPVGTEYTTEQKVFDGYEFVKVDEKGATPTGEVEEGTKLVTYIYKPVAKTGSVQVRYITEDGKELEATSPVKTDEPVGTEYTTEQKDFEGYEFVKVDEKGATPTGEVEEGTKLVTYIYKPVAKTGSVQVRYITEDGKELEATSPVKTDEPVGTEYTTEQKDFEGYEFVKVDEKGATPTGEVEEGTKLVTYIYKPVAKTGSVQVRYITEDGKELEATSPVKTDEPVGTEYTTEQKDFEGYEFVKVDEKGATPTGEVEEGTKLVTYIYKPVAVAKTGSVQVRYITEDGKVLEATSPVKTDEPVGTEYTTEQKDFEGYEFVKVDETGAPAKGTVAEEDQVVTYIYKPVAKTGSVVVHYVDETGSPIKSSVVDTPSTSTNTPYDTTDNKPSRITTPGGKTYELVPTKTVGNETGSVVEGTTEVTYVYREVKGDVVVHYVDENGNVIKTPVVDTENGTVGGDYDTSDNCPKVIVFNGKRYILVESRIPNNAKGKVVEGETHVTYVYKQENDKPTTPNQPTTPSTTPVTETTKVTPKTSAILPETGESTSALALVGLALLGTVAVASRRRKEK